VLHLRISLHLRTVTLAAALCAALGMAGAAVWANHTGLPDEWRRMIEAELGRHGTHARIGSLRYVPLEGIVAGDVELFSQENPGVRLAHIQRVLLDLDVSKLMRGKVRLERLELSDARVTLPTVEGAPDLVVEHLNGRVLMNAGRVIEVRDARGMIGGVALDFGARVIGNSPNRGGGGEEVEQIAARRLLLARIAREMGRWDFDPAEPPRIRVFLEGELDEPGDLQLDIGIESAELGRAGYSLEDVRLDGEVAGGVLSFGTVRARDKVGALDGRIEYGLQGRKGRFVGSSNLDAVRLMQAFFGVEVLKDFSFAAPPKIDIDAKFRLPVGEAPEWNVVGHGESGPFSFGEHPFEGAKAAFSSNGRDFYLRDIELRHAEGTARGKVLVSGGRVRYRVKTDVPVDPWRPFFVGKPLGKLLGDIEARPGHSVDVDLDGMAEVDNPLNWSCEGTIHTTGILYRGVPVRDFAARVWLNALEFRFDDVSAVLDDTRYPLRRVPGKKDPFARADNVTIDRVAKVARVEKLTGTCWPGQVVGAFNQKLGKNLERYRFHAPPTVRAGGSIDMRKGGLRTDFRVDFELSDGADYKFLGRDVPLRNPSGRVHVRGERVNVGDLALDAFGGRVEGRLVVAGGRKVDGEFHWRRASLSEIADCYRFGPVGDGRLTGRLKFSGSTAGLADLDGEGVLALEDGELFEVPIFGPLSPIINGVLGGQKEKVGFQLAREAFCTFTITKGIFATGDFHTETPSFVITGEGTADLADKTLDMTMRLDARGLYGVITLPLRPFYGFFQFRGTGPLKKPEWRNVMFTEPAGGIPAPGAPPKARPIGPGNAGRPGTRPPLQPRAPKAVPKARPVPRAKDPGRRNRGFPARGRL